MKKSPENAMDPHAKTEKIKIEVEVDAQEREDWINNVALNVDVFMPSYCGYWAFGVSVSDSDDVWLVYEQVDEGRPSQASIAAAERAHKNGKPLPKQWYLLDRTAAERAYAHLVARIGSLESGDATDYDVAIQKALLGDVVYG